MNKNIILPIAVVVFIVALVGVLWFWSSKYGNPGDGQEATPITSDIIYFYGDSCKFCKELKKFLDDNKVAEKVKFDYVEVQNNKKNQDLMLSKAAECGLKQDELGVPFLYSEGKCLVGVPDIEKFFREKAGL